MLTGPPEICGRPGQTKNFAPGGSLINFSSLKTDIFTVFLPRTGLANLSVSAKKFVVVET